jgi:hypothetical protein
VEVIQKKWEGLTDLERRLNLSEQRFASVLSWAYLLPQVVREETVGDAVPRPDLRSQLYQFAATSEQRSMTDELLIALQKFSLDYEESIYAGELRGPSRISRSFCSSTVEAKLFPVLEKLCTAIARISSQHGFKMLGAYLVHKEDCFVSKGSETEKELDQWLADERPPDWGMSWWLRIEKESRVTR